MPDPSSPAPALVSVVIPVRNRSDLLRRCLAALQAQTYPADRLEIIVVDNESTEDIAAVCRQTPGVQCLVGRGPGSYAARNTGILQAAGEIIALTDSDCLPDPRWIEHAVADLAALGCDLLGGRITYLEPDRPLNIYEIIERERFPLDIQARLVVGSGFAATANVVARRRVFDAIGLFDGRLTSLGDLEWGKRAHRRGYVMRYSDRAVVYHPRRSSHRAILLKIKRGAGPRQRQKVREGRVLSAFADFVLTIPFSPGLLLFTLTCPGVHGPIARLKLAGRTLQYSVVATAERIKALLGLPTYRGD